MIRHVHHRAMSEGVGNVEAKLIQPTEPGVSVAADVVFVCDVLHHVADRRHLAREAAQRDEVRCPAGAHRVQRGQPSRGTARGRENPSRAARGLVAKASPSTPSVRTSFPTRSSWS